MKPKICSLPSREMASHCAPGPPTAEMSANETSDVSFHGQCRPYDCTTKPTKAAIATRPCLISDSRKKPMAAA